MLWFLGWVVWASTAQAQPAPAPDAPADAPAAAPAAPALTVPPPTAPPPVAPAVTASPTFAPPGMVPTTPAAAAESEIESYRWQIAFADTASIVLLVSHTNATATVGALTYLLAGPVIHGAHDEGGRTAASLALRVGLPLLTAAGLTALAAHQNTCAPDDNDCDSGALIAAVEGLLVGGLAAMVIDTTLLARPHVVHRETRLTLSPHVSVTPERTSVGILGRF
jgi:hypothetical protein